MAAGKDIGHAGVEWVIAHSDLAVLEGGIAQRLRPVINVIDLHAAPGRNFGCALRGGRQRPHLKFQIVGNLPMRAGASRRHATFVSISRRQPKRWVLDRIVDLVEILRQIVVQLWQRPAACSFGLTDLVTCRTLRVIWVFPARL